MVWVKLDCPRCKAASSVSATFAGQYTACPACQSRVLVPINAPKTSAPPSAPSAGSPPPAAAAVANGPAGQLGPGRAASPATSWSGQGVNVPPPAPGTGVRAAAPAARAGVMQSAPSGSAGMDVPLSPPRADVPLSPPRADGPAMPVAPPAPPRSSTALPAIPPAGVPLASAPSPVNSSPRSGFAASPPRQAAGPLPSVPAPGIPVPNGLLSAGAMGTAVAPPVAAPLPAVAPPGGTRKVARFIAADPAESMVQLAADGQLPNLQLVDAEKPVVETAKTSTMNPLIVLAAIAASFCASVMLLLTDFGSSEGEQHLSQVRQQLEAYYQGDKGKLAPYQVHLREAQQAYSRGDRKTERQHYRKVLDQLRAEGGSRFRGLTGTPTSDKKLENLLSTLLGDDQDSMMYSEEG